MTNHTLRPATLADLPEIMRLERVGFAAAIQESEATFADRIRTFPQGCLVLARDDGNLSGYLCAELWSYTPEVVLERFARDHSASATHDPVGDEIYISSMVIDPACRGSSLAKRLCVAANSKNDDTPLASCGFVKSGRLHILQAVPHPRPIGAFPF